MIVLSENIFNQTVSTNCGNSYVRFSGVYLHSKCEDNSGSGMPDICYFKKADMEKIIADLDFFPNVAQHYSIDVIKFDDTINKGIVIIKANLIIKMEYPKLKKAYGLITCITEKIGDLNKN